jgi:hypothetical protein
MKKNPFHSKWRIIEMEHWDSDYIDLVVPGHITFEKDDLGEFQFGTMRGELDCRFEKHGDEMRVEFSWQGESEIDPASGRGWATIKEGELNGRLYIHLGDDSWFRAVKL